MPSLRLLTIPALGLLLAGCVDMVDEDALDSPAYAGIFEDDNPLRSAALDTEAGGNAHLAITSDGLAYLVVVGGNGNAVAGVSELPVRDDAGSNSVRTSSSFAMYALPGSSLRDGAIRSDMTLNMEIHRRDRATLDVGGSVFFGGDYQEGYEEALGFFDQEGPLRFTADSGYSSRVEFAGGVATMTDSRGAQCTIRLDGGESHGVAQAYADCQSQEAEVPGAVFRSGGAYHVLFMDAQRIMYGRF